MLTTTTRSIYVQYSLEKYDSCHSIRLKFQHYLKGLEIRLLELMMMMMMIFVLSHYFVKKNSARIHLLHIK